MKIYKEIFKKISITTIAVIGIFYSLAITYAKNTTEETMNYIKENIPYLTVDENTIARKPYDIRNSNKQVYFFGSYSFFSVNSITEIEQVKKQILRKEVLALIKDDNILIVSNYISPETSCTTIPPETADILKTYPESFITTEKDIFLIGNIQEETECYINNGKLYLPKDNLSKKDMEYLKNNNKKIQETFLFLTGKSLNEIYHYVTRNTSYNHDALYYNENIISPYLVSSFFDKKKVVCDGYSKTFYFLAKKIYPEKKIERITGSRQKIDTKTTEDKKLFLHSWVKIDNNYYDPTYDDNNDATEKDEYFSKSKTCFNLDHYAEGRIMFKNKQERINYIKKHSKTLISECPNTLTQTIGRDNAIKEFITYILNNNSIPITKKIICKTYQICDLSAQTAKDLKKELAQYTIKFGKTSIKLDNLILTNPIKSNFKLILDQIIKKIKIKIFFFSPEQKKQYIKNMKMRIMLLLLDKEIPEKVKNELKYLNKEMVKL